MIRKIVVWPLCLLFVAGMVMGGYGSVICVNNGGQFSVELNCQTNCCNYAETCEVFSSNDQTDTHDHCTNCNDTPFFEFTWAKRLSNNNTRDLTNIKLTYSIISYQPATAGIKGQINHYLYQPPCDKFSSLLTTTAILLC